MPETDPSASGSAPAAMPPGVSQKKPQRGRRRPIPPQMLTAETKSKAAAGRRAARALGVKLSELRAIGLGHLVDEFLATGRKPDF
jgi:hypothetical protein